MQNASLPQKAGRGGARRALRAAPLLAAPMATRASLAEDHAPGTATAGPGTGASDAPDAEASETAPEEAVEVTPPPPQPGWSPAAAQPPQPAARSGRSATPGSGGTGDEGDGAEDGDEDEAVPEATTPRVTADALAAAQDPLLAIFLTLPGPTPTDLASLEAGATAPTGATTVPAANVVEGVSAEGAIATLTITRRVAPDWVRDAVADDPGVVRFLAAATAALPDAGRTSQVSVAWADIDGDGRRDGHLYRIDNANTLAVTVSVRFGQGEMLPGSATVAGGTAGLVWVPIDAPAALRFLGSDAAGAPIDWISSVGTQAATDMRSTTVTRTAWAGEVHAATAGRDVFLFGPGQGVDAILGYDPDEDSVVLPAGTTAQVVSISGTAGLLVGGTNREGIVFDGIAWSPALAPGDLNVLFA